MDRATRREERIKHIDEAVAKLRAEQRRLKALTSREERKRDTRRKILLGVLMQKYMQKNKSTEERVLADLDNRLERPRDRELFGLPPRQGGEKGATPP